MDEFDGVFGAERFEHLCVEEIEEWRVGLGVSAKVDGGGIHEQAAVVAHEEPAKGLDGLRLLDLLLHDLVEVFDHQHQNTSAGAVMGADGLDEGIGNDGIVLLHGEPVIQVIPGRAVGAEYFADGEQEIRERAYAVGLLREAHNLIPGGKGGIALDLVLDE